MKSNLLCIKRHLQWIGMYATSLAYKPQSCIKIQQVYFFSIQDLFVLHSAIDIVQVPNKYTESQAEWGTWLASLNVANEAAHFQRGVKELTVAVMVSPASLQPQLM